MQEENKVSKPAKTSGAEWLYLSMASFNGSGYAIKNSPEEYVASYKAYNMLRKREKHLNTLDQFPEEAMFYATALVDAKDSEKIPGGKKQEAFDNIYNKIKPY